MNQQTLGLLLFILPSLHCVSPPVIHYSFCSLSNPHCKPLFLGAYSTLEFGNLSHNVRTYDKKGRPPLSVSCMADEPMHWVLSAQGIASVNDVTSHLVLSNSSNLYYYEIWLTEVISGIIRCESYTNKSKAAEIYVDGRYASPQYRHSNGLLLFFFRGSVTNDSLPFLVPCIMDHYPLDIRLDNMELMKTDKQKMTSSTVTEACLKCMQRKTGQVVENCTNTYPKCGVMTFPSGQVWSQMKIDEWQSCMEDFNCTLEKINSDKRINQDCNQEGRITCSDFYTAVQDVSGSCRSDDARYSNFDDIEACMMETTGMKVKNAKYDPRYGFLIDSVDYDAIYMCPTLGTASAVFLGSYSPSQKIGTELQITKDPEKTVRGLSCQVPQRWLEKITFEAIQCRNLFECDTQVETNGFQTYFRDFNQIKAGEPISKIHPESKTFGKVIETPWRQGAAMCFLFLRFDEGFIWNFEYFFTGLNSRPYLMTDKFPLEAIISLEANSTDDNSTAITCTVTTFVLYPIFMFTVHFPNGSVINVTEQFKRPWFTLNPLVQDNSRASQTLELIENLDIALVSCSSPHRNSTKWARQVRRMRETMSNKISSEIANASDQALLIGILSSVGLLITSATLGVLYLFRRYRTVKSQSNKEFTTQSVKEVSDENRYYKSVPVNLTNMVFPEMYRISSSGLQLNLNEVLGEGAFGVCVTGEYDGETVAVKMPKAGVECMDFQQFCNEAKLMAHVGAHENIIRFIGADVDVVTGRIFKIVVEFAALGDLQKCLQKSRCSPPPVSCIGSGYVGFDVTSPSETASIPTATGLDFGNLCSFCEQIASGMEFLIQKNVVHSDLAARNVLVFPNHIVKITDFGLSRRLYLNPHYMGKPNSMIPWRWSAIEVLRYKAFSPMADIWSFGVTLWEIFTMGELPYESYEWSSKFAIQLERGLRLQQPQLASDEIYQFMLRTWSIAPSVRPSFSEAKLFFQRASQQKIEQSGGIQPYVDASCVM